MSRRLAALGAVLLTAVFAGSARAGAVPWTFAEMEPPNGTFSYALDVNLAGQATGVMSDESGFAPVYRGFFYDPQTGLVDIGDLGGDNTFAVALNNRGVVTGTSQTDKGAVHAFLFTPGIGMRDIGAGLFPSDINETGTVIGRLGSNDHAFSWTDAGGVQDLGSGTVHGFGAPGTLFGSRGGSPGVFVGVDFAAFIPIETGDALDGNIFGQSVGKLSEPDGERAFVWDGDSYVMPTAPGVVSSVGQSINNAGLIAIHGTDADGKDVPLLFYPPYDSPLGSFDGWAGFRLLDYTAIDDVGHLAGAGRREDGAVHGFVMTPYFPLQAGSAVSILLQGLPSNDPFRTMAERTLNHFVHGVSETGCFQMKRLRQTLAVADGTHFTAAQRAAGADALAAVLKMGGCRDVPPVAPTTVPYIFTRKNERVQLSVRLVRPHKIKVSVESDWPDANVVAVNVPKKRVKGTVRITLVARRLLNGGATPATVTVR